MIYSYCGLACALLHRPACFSCTLDAAKCEGAGAVACIAAAALILVALRSERASILWTGVSRKHADDSDCGMGGCTGSRHQRRGERSDMLIEPAEAIGLPSPVSEPTAHRTGALIYFYWQTCMPAPKLLGMQHELQCLMWNLDLAKQHFEMTVKSGIIVEKYI